MKFLYVGLLCVFGIFSAQAEQMKKLGAWDVHYIAFDTAFLAPQVAKHYKIKRSKNKALLNISVLNSRNQQAQDAVLTGHLTTLMGRKTELEFKQVKDGDAIYYLATFPIEHKEFYRFDVAIRQGNKSQRLKFQQQFIVD